MKPHHPKNVLVGLLCLCGWFLLVISCCHNQGFFASAWTIVPHYPTTTGSRTVRVRRGLYPIQSWKTQLQKPQSSGYFLAHDNVDREPPNFLWQVEESVARVLEQYTSNDKEFVLTLPAESRESFGVARLLQKRLQSFHRNKDCPRCWLQRAHCICDRCPPLTNELLLSTKPPPKGDNHPNIQIHRIFLLMHHKEICLAVDTAKLILACFPDQCRLVVAGMGPEYQASMQEMLQAMDPLSVSCPENHNNTSANHLHKCLVLFPTEDAKTFAEVIQAEQEKLLSAGQGDHNNNDNDRDKRPTTYHLDLIVLDGTWSQARKLHARYFPSTSMGGPTRVQLASDTLVSLQRPPSTQDENDIDTSHPTDGRQLRRHPIDWRTISTMEATRLLLQDMFQVQKDTASTNMDENNSDSNDDKILHQMLEYQRIANQAARRQLGPPRIKGVP